MYVLVGDKDRVGLLDKRHASVVYHNEFIAKYVQS